MFLSFFVILAVALLLLIPALTNEGKTLAQNAPKWEASIDDYLNTHDTIDILSFSISSDTARTALNTSLERVTSAGQDLSLRLASGTFRFLIDFLLYLITTFYLMLMGGRPIWRFINTLPLKYRKEMHHLFNRINIVLAAYIRGQVLLVLIMSVASFIILSVLGVHYSLILGIMTGVLELVPFVGPYLAITVSSVVAYFQGSGNFGLKDVGLVIAVAAALFVLRQLEDYVVIPNLIGRIVELPALLIIFTTVTGAALAGPMGLLLGVPVVAVIRIIIGYLYYKLVDADRTKVVLDAESGPEQLVNFLNEQPPQSRWLVVAGTEPEYLHNPELLAQVKELTQAKALDVAFYCGEDDKACELVRKSGFPVTTMEQEQFFESSSH